MTERVEYPGPEGEFALMQYAAEVVDGIGDDVVDGLSEELLEEASTQ